MIKSVVTFLTSLIASLFTRNTRALCLRRLVAALLFFQLVSFGVMFLHLNMSVHVISPITGEVIHGSVEHIQVSQTEQALFSPRIFLQMKIPVNSLISFFVLPLQTSICLRPYKQTKSSFQTKLSRENSTSSIGQHDYYNRHPKTLRLQAFHRIRVPFLRTNLHFCPSYETMTTPWLTQSLSTRVVS